MVIQINTDRNIEGSEDMHAHFESVLSENFSHYGDQLTRIEVHLKDENAEKAGPDDKRCLIELRPAGLSPIAVTEYAESIHLAFEGAVEKASHALDHAFGKSGRK